MPTPSVGQYWFTLRDAGGNASTHKVHIPAPSSWQEAAVAPAITYANDVRVAMTIAAVEKITVVLPFTLSGYPAIDPGQRSQMRGIFHPQPRRRPLPYYSIPAFKNELVTVDENGVRSVIPITGAVATLVSAWTSGLGGVRPLGALGAYYTSCPPGTLRKD